MGNIGKISILHVIFLCMTAIGLKSHVTILPPILETAKRDAWMSVLIASILIFPWLLWIIYIQNKSKQKPIKDWLPEKLGNVGAKIVLYTTVLFLYIQAAFTLRETILWVSATFLIETPDVILTIIYIILCFSLVSTNMLTIVIVNTLVLAFVIIFGFYVAIVNIQVKDYDLLFPLLEHGMDPVLKAVVYPASAFIEFYLLLFLQHHLKERLKWQHIAWVMFIFTGLTLGPLVGAIIEFGPTEAANQRYPAYEEWDLATIGRFIEHMDFLSVYQWLTGAFIRIGVILYVACDILNLTEKRKHIWKYMMPPFLFLNLILLIFNDNIFLFVNYHQFLIMTFLFIFILSIILIIASKIPNREN